MIKVLTFNDGRIAFATGRIDIQLNKQKAISVEEIESTDEIEKELFERPKNIKFDKDKKEFSFIKK